MMGIVDQAVNITVAVNSGTTTGFTFQDDLYDYRYYRLAVAGPQASTVSFILNGVAMSFPGSTVMDVPVYSLSVTGSGTIILHGVKSARKLFGEGNKNIEYPPYN